MYLVYCIYLKRIIVFPKIIPIINIIHLPSENLLKIHVHAIFSATLYKNLLEFGIIFGLFATSAVKKLK